MKKFLAVLLAMLMMVPMGTVAMAAGETDDSDPPIVFGVTGEIEPTYKINEDYGYRIFYKAKYPITDVRFENGRMEADYSQYGATFKLVDPDYDKLSNDRPIDDSFKDNMIFTFENGMEYSHPIEFTYLDPSIRLKVTSTGSCETRNMPVGGTATFHIEVIDKRNRAVPPFQFKLSHHAASSSGSSKIMSKIDKHFEVSEPILDENEGTASFTVTSLVTPAMVGSGSYAASHSFSFEMWDSTGSTVGHAYSGSAINVSTLSQPPDGFEPDEPSKPAAGDVIRDANVALAAGKERPAKAQPVTTAAGTTITAVPVKLSGLEASIYLDTMDLLATGKVGLKASINSGAAEVILPAGFTHTPEPGRFGYPLGFQKDPRGSDLMTELVKGDTAKTETYKLGGNVVLPTTATITIKTKLDGKVNVYYWNDETRKATLIASPTAADGRVTFATKQLGHLILTTGTI